MADGAPDGGRRFCPVNATGLAGLARALAARLERGPEREVTKRMVVQVPAWKLAMLTVGMHAGVLGRSDDLIEKIREPFIDDDG